ncbi:3-keto-disaccharide hydrolase [Arsenicibacter rosenii]|uniref:3-keto-alpha-glucoside-1,2-lyase/3-keto-2-hydroxy-glucal hydratase domain-containing protein n=1 Tax=Arsenicibacter rosenii TaxID=1750698 RepID=A0A1S2VGD0_9BACT|nr:DUF1080 domain-containing protein [Arsenicibacter rosenii]OIN57325.1 hypothetical protein BLX24_20315 [Arsenicibacter rosenii]
MKKSFLSLILSCLSLSALFAQSSAKKEDWQSLFNGKDLTGWDIKIAGQPLNDNYKNTFLVEDGMLRVSYKEYDKFNDKYGHIYYKTPYSHYRIRFEYRFQGDQVPGGANWNVRNSGIMFHSQSAASLTFEQHFPVSLEMQLLGGLGKGPRHTGNLCSPGTIVDMNGKFANAHCIDSDSKTYDGDQWVKAEAIVLGDSVVYHLIDGNTVLAYQNIRIGGTLDGDFRKMMNIANADAWAPKLNTQLSEGYIALQAESHAIDFRGIELLNLKGCMNPRAVNYKAYYVKHDPSACKFRR